jgi:hypothetical protein
VPNAAAGPHVVTAVGDTFVCFCNPEGKFTVLGAKAPSKLPRTGIYVGVLLVTAAALIVFGRAFVAESRRRRRTSAAFELEDDELMPSGRR